MAKNKKRINAVKTVVDTITFDSELESKFYKHLKSNTEHYQIKEIICHPTFHVIKPFEINCWKCLGTGKKESEKTSKLIKCPRCKGRGTKSRKGTDYTPDFMVQYKDGSIRYFDVKGGWVNDRFPIIKKAFEKIVGVELVVITWDNDTKKWAWK